MKGFGLMKMKIGNQVKQLGNNNMTKELKRIIRYIEDPTYVVMWLSPEDVFHMVSNITPKEEDGELQAFLRATDYIDLYNITPEDIKVYKEVI